MVNPHHYDNHPAIAGGPAGSGGPAGGGSSPLGGGVRSVVAMSGTSPHVMVVTNEGRYLVYGLDLEKGGEGRLLKVYEIGGQGEGILGGGDDDGNGNGRDEGNGGDGYGRQRGSSRVKEGERWRDGRGVDGGEEERDEKEDDFA